MVDHLQSRVTPWRQYAIHVKVRGTLLKMDVVRVASELKQSLNIEDEEITTKQLSQKVKNQLKQDHFNNWQKKVTHGYNQKSIRENPDVDHYQLLGFENQT